MRLAFAESRLLQASGFQQIIFKRAAGTNTATQRNPAARLL
jgi:hypothetical protein